MMTGTHTTLEVSQEVISGIYDELKKAGDTYLYRYFSENYYEVKIYFGGEVALVHTKKERAKT